MRFILSLRMNSSFITSGPGFDLALELLLNVVSFLQNDYNLAYNIPEYF